MQLLCPVPILCISTFIGIKRTHLMCSPRSLRAVIEHFRRIGWSFEIDATQPMIHLRYQGENGIFRCVTALDESDDLLQVVSIMPMTVPSKRRGAAAELCVRLSYGMKIGRFDLNHANGEFSFQTSSHYPEGDLKDGLITNVLGTNLFVVDHHFPAFIRVVHGELTPAEAVKDARNGHAPQNNGEGSPAAPQTLSRIRSI